MPALLLAGLDPVAALATNKLQASCGTVAATFTFAWRGLIRGRSVWAFAAAGALAAGLGASVAETLPRHVLEASVPLVLVCVALYFAFGRRPDEGDVAARMPAPIFAVTCCVAAGFYDGIFGPGTGAFLMIGFVTLMGRAIVRATALTKLVNAASNLGALAFFAATGRVVWPLGLVMAAGAILGSQIGARLAVRYGARIIRPLIVVVCCAMAIRLAADPTNPLRQAVAVVFAHLGS